MNQSPTSREVAQARTIEARIERLRERIKRMAINDSRAIAVAGILLGVLDLLGDEL